MLVYENGEVAGTIGGGELERKVIENAIQCLAQGKPRLFRHDLVHQLNMCCGGTVEVYIEPIMKRNKLYIFGAGHTGQALARLAVACDFDVFLIDDRKKYMDQCDTSQVGKMNLQAEQALQVLPFDDTTFVAIMTYDHALDREILLGCLAKPCAYLGMIGSQRKVEMTKKMFSQLGKVSMEALSKVDMPMGIDIGSEGPEEIAISIMARLVEVKRKKIHAKE